VGAFIAQYCHRAGIDARDMTVDVSFDKADEPVRLVNLKVRVELPHGQCADRQAAMRRVAEHCPVHATITSMADLDFEVLGQEQLAAVAA
jgi:uncharacterized OsmC-like protein